MQQILQFRKQVEQTWRTIQRTGLVKLDVFCSLQRERKKETALLSGRVKYLSFQTP